MENNVVFLKLKKNGKEVFYYPNPEVDFVVKEEKEIKQLIQVSYVASREEIRKREIKVW